MKFTFHGAANEVGRSCVELATKKHNYLFDCGIKLTEDFSEYPLLKDPSNIDAVFLSHAHLDHSGALPLFNYKGLDCPIYTNRMTKELSKMLMKDSLHIELLKEQHPAYSKENIYNVMDLMKHVPYQKEQNHKESVFQFQDAGHIPGSAMIKVTVDKKNVVYTGDYNTVNSQLLVGCEPKFKNTDVLITEATYGDRLHPSRSNEMDHFLKTVKETINKGASVLIPAFAVGRSQEILLMLNELKLKVPIYLDGMSTKVVKRFFDYPEYITNKHNLKKALTKVKFVGKQKLRQEIVKQQGIFVTTSGMLDGGPIMEYLKHFYFDKDAALLLTGYQAEGTNGRLLMDEGNVYIDGNKIKVKCRTEKYDFSAHAGLKGLKSTIKKLKPEHLILNHGDPAAIEKLGKWAEESFSDMQVYKPKLEETINIK